MIDYDFSLLSHTEFESLSREILRKRDKLDFSTFAEGRDGGIDIRVSLPKAAPIIAQAKRYKQFRELQNSLKKEVEKVQKCAPSRYIISTSVSLSPANKEEIMKMFHPHIKNESDILGRQDLNKYLADYPEIETQFHKLWLTSSNLLEHFLNKKIFNATVFESKEIEETIRSYVMNPSFDHALKKLTENHYVIISGVPGIGKTTLARILIYTLLSPKFGYENFYYISKDLNEAYQVFQEGKKQIFFFDDFLGATRFTEREGHFEAQLLSFIRSIKGRKDKLFILTTREYILNEARTYHEKLDAENIDIAKCIISIDDYTKFIKAQILYNHLVDSGLNVEYIKAIQRDRNYMKLIEHPNFNPRIIESFIKQSQTESCSPEKYFDKIKGLFDNPQSVWSPPYEQLSQTAREMLQVLATMNPPVTLEDWRNAYEHFFSRTHLATDYLDEVLWHNNLKSLTGCFVYVSYTSDIPFVNYHNPGIRDFIVKTIASEQSIQKRLLKNTYFIEQVYSLFSDSSGFSDITIPPPTT